MTDPVFNTAPELSPSQIAKFAGVSPDTLRDWRHRGYIDGLGTLQENGRWKYDWLDALILFVYSEVSKCGLDISSVREWADPIAKHVTFRKLNQLGYAPQMERYFRFSKHAEFRTRHPSNPQDRWVGQPFENIETVSPKVPAIIVVDCEDLANRLPEAFDEVFRLLHEDLLREQREQG